LRGGAIERDALRNGGFDVIVSGLSKGCGSSRETAPFSELMAGCQLVIAKTIEKIYGQNCQNIGLLTSTDAGMIPRILAGDKIHISEFQKGLDPIAQDVVAYGGLGRYNAARLVGEVTPPPLETPARPMTMVEKIIAKWAIADAKTGRLGIPGVAPGDALFVRSGLRFSHEYVTPMAEQIFLQSYGQDAKVRNPGRVFAFRDHLTFLKLVMPKEHRDMGLLEQAESLAAVQQSFCERQGVRLYGEVEEGGSEAICHNAVLEDLARPGDLVVGTDSHTCTAGAIGCFAFGVGSTDMANAWFTEDVRVRVPETVRFNLTGTPPVGISAKDIILYVMSAPFFKEGKAIGKVLEFGGPGTHDLNMDERAVLTNMAVEAGATTGIIAADEVTLAWLQRMRDLDDAQVETLRQGIITSDPDATYFETFDIDLSELKGMVALPGDPRNGIPLEQLTEEVVIDIAYGGSCTGGKMTDMDQYASVLREAVARGMKVAPGVQFYVQFGSQKIKEYARQQGYLEMFTAAGAELVNPSCGACIKAGPGVSDRKDQITVSAINRNFPGRSGPGQVYLASPAIVAASAIAGKIVSPADLFPAPEAAAALA
ncbi:MAG: aconitase family protein, partial [Planctomycetota bacterium]